MKMHILRSAPYYAILFTIGLLSNATMYSMRLPLISPKDYSLYEKIALGENPDEPYNKKVRSALVVAYIAQMLPQNKDIQKYALKMIERMWPNENDNFQYGSGSKITQLFNFLYKSLEGKQYSPKDKEEVKEVMNTPFMYEIDKQLFKKAFPDNPKELERFREDFAKAVSETKESRPSFFKKLQQKRKTNVPEQSSSKSFPRWGEEEFSQEPAAVELYPSSSQSSSYSQTTSSTQTDPEMIAFAGTSAIMVPEQEEKPGFGARAKEKIMQEAGAFGSTVAELFSRSENIRLLESQKVVNQSSKQDEWTKKIEKFYKDESLLFNTEDAVHSWFNQFKSENNDLPLGVREMVLLFNQNEASKVWIRLHYGLIGLYEGQLEYAKKQFDQVLTLKSEKFFNLKNIALAFSTLCSQKKIKNVQASLTSLINVIEKMVNKAVDEIERKKEQTLIKDVALLNWLVFAQDTLQLLKDNKQDEINRIFVKNMSEKQYQQSKESEAGVAQSSTQQESIVAQEENQGRLKAFRKKLPSLSSLLKKRKRLPSEDFGIEIQPVLKAEEEQTLVEQGLSKKQGLLSRLVSRLRSKKQSQITPQDIINVSDLQKEWENIIDREKSPEEISQADIDPWVNQFKGVSTDLPSGVKKMLRLLENTEMSKLWMRFHYGLVGLYEGQLGYAKKQFDAVSQFEFDAGIVSFDKELAKRLSALCVANGIENIQTNLDKSIKILEDYLLKKTEKTDYSDAKKAVMLWLEFAKNILELIRLDANKDIDRIFIQKLSIEELQKQREATLAQMAASSSIAEEEPELLYLPYSGSESSSSQQPGPSTPPKPDLKEKSRLPESPRSGSEQFEVPQDQAIVERNQRVINALDGLTAERIDKQKDISLDLQRIFESENPIVSTDEQAQVVENLSILLGYLYEHFVKDAFKSNHIKQFMKVINDSKDGMKDLYLKGMQASVLGYVKDCLDKNTIKSLSSDLQSLMYSFDAFKNKQDNNFWQAYFEYIQEIFSDLNVSQNKPSTQIVQTEESAQLESATTPYEPKKPDTYEPKKPDSRRLRVVPSVQTPRVQETPEIKKAVAIQAEIPGALTIKSSPATGPSEPSRQKRDLPRRKSSGRFISELSEIQSKEQINKAAEALKEFIKSDDFLNFESRIKAFQGFQELLLKASYEHESSEKWNAFIKQTINEIEKLRMETPSIQDLKNTRFNYVMKALAKFVQFSKYSRPFISFVLQQTQSKDFLTDIQAEAVDLISASFASFNTFINDRDAQVFFENMEQNILRLDGINLYQKQVQNIQGDDIVIMGLQNDLIEGLYSIVISFIKNEISLKDINKLFIQLLQENISICNEELQDRNNQEFWILYLESILDIVSKSLEQIQPVSVSSESPQTLKISEEKVLVQKGESLPGLSQQQSSQSKKKKLNKHDFKEESVPFLRFEQKGQPLTVQEEPVEMVRESLRSPEMPLDIKAIETLLQKVSIPEYEGALVEIKPQDVLNAQRDMSQLIEQLLAASPDQIQQLTDQVRVRAMPQKNPKKEGQLISSQKNPSENSDFLYELVFETARSILTFIDSNDFIDTQKRIEAYKNFEALFKLFKTMANQFSEQGKQKIFDLLEKQQNLIQKSWAARMQQISKPQEKKLLSFAKSTKDPFGSARGYIYLGAPDDIYAYILGEKQIPQKIMTQADESWQRLDIKNRKDTYRLWHFNDEELEKSTFSEAFDSLKKRIQQLKQIWEREPFETRKQFKGNLVFQFNDEEFEKPTFDEALKALQQRVFQEGNPQRVSLPSVEGREPLSDEELEISRIALDLILPKDVTISEMRKRIANKDSKQLNKIIQKTADLISQYIQSDYFLNKDYREYMIRQSANLNDFFKELASNFSSEEKSETLQLINKAWETIDKLIQNRSAELEESQQIPKFPKRKAPPPPVPVPSKISPEEIVAINKKVIQVLNGLPHNDVLQEFIKKNGAGDPIVSTMIQAQAVEDYSKILELFYTYVKDSQEKNNTKLKDDIKGVYKDIHENEIYKNTPKDQFIVNFLIRKEDNSFFTLMKIEKVSIIMEYFQKMLNFLIEKSDSFTNLKDKEFWKSYFNYFLTRVQSLKGETDVVFDLQKDVEKLMQKFPLIPTQKFEKHAVEEEKFEEEGAKQINLYVQRWFSGQRDDAVKSVVSKLFNFTNSQLQELIYIQNQKPEGQAILSQKSLGLFAEIIKETVGFIETFIGSDLFFKAKIQQQMLQKMDVLYNLFTAIANQLPQENKKQALKFLKNQWEKIKKVWTDRQIEMQEKIKFKPITGPLGLSPSPSSLKREAFVLPKKSQTE